MTILKTEQERSGCLFAFLKLFRAKPDQLPYKRKDYLLTKAERALFDVLNDGRYLVFAKVRLADLLWMPKGTQGRQGHFNRVQSKHIDFLLCDQTVRPLLAIELDDASHDRSDRIARDGFVDAALKAAGLPLLRIRAKGSYDAAEIMGQVERAFQQSA